MIEPNDFEVECCGSVYLFRPLTEAAKEATFGENAIIQAEPWQRMDDGIAVDHGCVVGLAEFLKENGFSVV